MTHVRESKLHWQAAYYRLSAPLTMILTRGVRCGNCSRARSKLRLAGDARTCTAGGLGMIIAEVGSVMDGQGGSGQDQCSMRQAPRFAFGGSVRADA